MGVCRLTHLLHSIHERDHIFDWSFRQDAVAQIEDVPGPSARLFENRFSLRAKMISIGEESYGIEIAHHAHVMTDTLPSFVESHTPIKPNNIAARFAHQFK